MDHYRDCDRVLQETPSVPVARHVGQRGFEKRRDIGVCMHALSYLLSAQAGVHGTVNQWSRRDIYKHWPHLGAVSGIHEDFVKEFDGRAGIVNQR